MPTTPDQTPTPTGDEPTATLDQWLVSADGRFRACFTDTGEGADGEYDEEDPDDVPLLRIDVQINEADSPMAEDAASPGTTDPADPDHGWYWVRDGSYCTQVNARTVTGAQMYRLLQRVLTEIDGATDSVRRQLQLASWMHAGSAD